MTSPKPSYRLHIDGTISAPWMQAVRGQTIYLPPGHASGLGGQDVYVNCLGRLVPPPMTPPPCRRAGEARRAAA